MALALARRERLGKPSGPWRPKPGFATSFAWEAERLYGVNMLRVLCQNGSLV